MNSTITGIKCKLADFFGYWLSFTRPMHDLTNKEIVIMAVILGKRFELSKIITDPNRIDTFLFSKEIRNEIMQELDMSGTEFSGALSLLRKKNAISRSNIVNKKFIPDLGHNSKVFNFIINFEITDTQEIEIQEEEKKEEDAQVEQEETIEEEEEESEKDLPVKSKPPSPKVNISDKAQPKPNRVETSDLSHAHYFDKGY